ncbi:MAG TPA: PVC-type heme-binding CxxCH protein [Gemmataceae bacterium]|jgi:putative membrane-bound dehydrogenase-like protein|nr:PVC-type heme-binding CxxCH protein [Gemmataceae bacterium]
MKTISSFVLIVGISLLGIVASRLQSFPLAEDSNSDLTGPLAPKEEQKTFHLPPGFRIELVACEPNVVDPVAIAFDEDGRMYVAEMPGYPNGGVGTGSIHSGKIKRLEDRDGDGFYEHCTTFAEGLRFPTSVMPWKNGLLVSVAPDIVFLEDTKGDGRADQKRTLYTGLGLDNIQQLINSLQWGLDNWVYGCAGSNGGTVRSAEKPEIPPVTLRNRGVRFHPEKPGSLEPTSGGGQFGLAADAWQNWFTATNSQHLRHIVLADHYFRRNPNLAVPNVTVDIPDHGAACKVFRISPFESWRVERTRRRKSGPDAQRFPSTELVPGGFITSACSPVVYTADLFPKAFQDNVFVCDPANNLVHRDILIPLGATFVAQRADADREFLASTDTWFRPVNLTIGPDGALYLVDFYREVIETPLSLPDDIKKGLNLESRGRGRIWRIVPDKAKPSPKPALRKATSEELVQHLGHPNIWWRLTAQRLLAERQDRSAVPALEKLARESKSEYGRAHALWTLDGLGALTDSIVVQALRDPSAGVREQALRLADTRLANSYSIVKAATDLTDDPSLKVRFQLAFIVGEAETPLTTKALAQIALRDFADPWSRLAVLSSAKDRANLLLDFLTAQKSFTSNAGPDNLQFLNQLASLVGAQADNKKLKSAMGLLRVGASGPAPWQMAVIIGLAQGLQRRNESLNRLFDHPPPDLKEIVAEVKPIFASSAATAQDEKLPADVRLSAIRLLAYGPWNDAAGALKSLLRPQNSGEIQLAAVRAMANQDHPEVAEILLRSWEGYSPQVRREVLEALLARRDRVARLMDAIEKKIVLPGQLDPSRLDQLRKYPDAKIRQRADRLLAGQGSPDRQQALNDLRPALNLKSDAARGKMVFKKVCSTCHRLDNEGVEVGPDLLSALRNKTSETLLIDILDPSREVDPRYLNYQIQTKAGRVFTGMIASETASSLTLRRAEKVEDTILRSQIDEIQATGKSLMPEGLEMQLSKQDVADVIGYLLSVAAPRN